jgi:hypothetical protein
VSKTGRTENVLPNAPRHDPHLQVLYHASRQSAWYELARPLTFEQVLQAPAEVCRVVLLPSLPAAAAPWYLL